MAVYEYECETCGERFEELVGPHVGLEDEDVRCPSCSGAKVRRLISSYSPIQRQLTPSQAKRLEETRRVDRDRRRQEFKKRQQAERVRRGNPNG